ncbi:MAG TPA: FAD-linked oxidase C-terminal domain-containing protein [Gaiellaceae bacterium]|jgi:D-lactate dehydrogenase (cytochrome)|nr:FAD-linked oxidase C-terminal domain-containing protein [Gaiellaceae bacterium]
MAVAHDLRSQLLRVISDERRVADGDSALDQHAADLSYHEPHRPDVVVYPESTEEVAAVLELANRTGTPVVPFGAGTSLEGHVIPLRGGISLDLTRMNAILALRPDDLTATVQPGVTRSQVEAAAGPHGLWFPVDPGADATLGGMAATNASGTTTVRYGGMRAHVLALEVVLADGSVIRTGSRAVKTSAGYNLTGLFVGSEGTLGVITELTLRLHPIPDDIVVARAAFPSVEAACRAAAAIIGSGVPVTRCELLDATTIAALNAFSGTSFPESPYLFIEFGGSGVDADLETTRELSGDEGASAFESERDPTARAQMWNARHNALMASLALNPGAKAMATDVAVPVSELAAAMEHARQALGESGLNGGIVGHVGDGNFHVAFLLDPDDAASIAKAEALNGRLVDDALARGGTCTGEHGIGFGKLAYLEREHGDLVPLYRGLKQLFDPKGLLNPGKVVP